MHLGVPLQVEKYKHETLKGAYQPVKNQTRALCAPAQKFMYTKCYLALNAVS